MKKAVRIARVSSQPYAERPLPQGGYQIDRLDNPARIDRYPYLCVDLETREICITKSLRIPLEQVEYYEIAEPSEEDMEWEKRTTRQPAPAPKPPAAAQNATPKRKRNARADAA